MGRVLALNHPLERASEVCTTRIIFEIAEAKPGWCVLFHPSAGPIFRIGPVFRSTNEAQIWLDHQSALVLQVLEGPDVRFLPSSK